MVARWETPAKKKRFDDFPNRRIALIYDFDGTLSPDSMQDHTILPFLKIKPSEFWERVKVERSKNKNVEILTYMRLLAMEMNEATPGITRQKLKSLGRKVPYFPGVEEWFEFWNRYVIQKSKGYVTVEHHIVSAGLKEIIDGTSIAKHFKEIFASEYQWDDGRAVWPARAITDASKPQYIFRVNKGLTDLSQNINQHMPDEQRPVPFRNILYFGDGETDVPSMAVTRKYHGYAIAVHKPDDEVTKSKCETLFKSGRIDVYAPADYRPKSALHTATQAVVDRMLADIRFEAMKHGFTKLRW